MIPILLGNGREFWPFSEIVSFLLGNFDPFSEMVPFLLGNFGPFLIWYHFCWGGGGGGVPTDINGSILKFCSDCHCH